MASASTVSHAAAAASSAPPKVLPLVRGIVFDMDGTLTLPVIDFVEMRRRAGIPPGADILETIENIADDVERAAAHAAVEEVEKEGLAGLAPAIGLHSVLKRLDALGLPRGLVTRNNRGAVEVFHERLLLGVEEEEEETAVEGGGGGGEVVAANVVAVEREEEVSTTATATATAAAVEGHGRHHNHHHKHHHHRQSHSRSRRLPPFHPALARDFKPPKPSPAALIACAEAWGVRFMVLGSFPPSSLERERDKGKERENGNSAKSQTKKTKQLKN